MFFGRTYMARTRRGLATKVMAGGNPRQPSTLAPHVNISPSLVHTAVCEKPAATSRTRTGSSSSTSRHSRTGSPSAVELPQMYTCPPSYVWSRLCAPPWYTSSMSVHSTACELPHDTLATRTWRSARFLTSLGS